MSRTLICSAVVALLLSFDGVIKAQDSHPLASLDVEALVEQLRNLPSPIPAGVPSNGVERPSEVLRREIYYQLMMSSPASVRALARGFEDPDPNLRRSVALALGALSGGWWSFEGVTRKVNIEAALPELIAALNDTDLMVRAWAAQAMGNVGAKAAVAVPNLLTLLASDDEGSRNSACIALRGIGPAAQAALPALRKALGDPSADVRRFAGIAIQKIEGPPQ